MAQPLWKTDMVFPPKVKHRITGYDPGISRHPNALKAGTQADPCATTVCESITHDDPTGDTTQMSIDRGTGKQDGIYADSGISSSCRKSRNSEIRNCR